MGIEESLDRQRGIGDADDDLVGTDEVIGEIGIAVRQPRLRAERSPQRSHRLAGGGAVQLAVADVLVKLADVGVHRRPHSANRAANSASVMSPATIRE